MPADFALPPTAEIRRRLRLLKERLAHGDIVVISSPREKRATRDISFPFVQDKNILYMTGLYDTPCTFVYSRQKKVSLVLVEKRSEAQRLWSGAPPVRRSRLAEFGIELRAYSKEQIRDVLRDLARGHERLLYENHLDSPAAGLASTLLHTPASLRRGLPRALVHADSIFAALRTCKSPWEIRQIRAAIKTAHQALVTAAPAIHPGRSERDIALALEWEMSIRGASPSFPTICAAGKNAAILHHAPSRRKLRRNELVLLDFGAQQLSYCSDITRCFPLSDSLPRPLMNLYQAVLLAQERAIAAIRPGQSLRKIQSAAESVLRDFLQANGYLKKKAESASSFFPHSIGHSLGLDVHDPMDEAGSTVTLEPGMVITIEPGLYFQKTQRGLPACGVRIEDNILVTKGGAENLSQQIPKQLEELRSLMCSHTSGTGRVL